MKGKGFCVQGSKQEILKVLSPAKLVKQIVSKKARNVLLEMKCQHLTVGENSGPA